MEFLPEEIEEYARQHSENQSDLLKALSRETYLKVMSPRMLSGHLQGRFLAMISKLIQPDFILEIGTYTGYSAVCLSEGLSERGKLLTIDYNPELKPILEKYLMKSPKANQIEFKIGKALEIIPAIREKIDLVFIDADKENYVAYFDLVIDKVRSGGLILADNVLWSGKVVQELNDKDRSTKAIQEFNIKVNSDPRVEVMLLPLRDGISLIRKK